MTGTAAQSGAVDGMGASIPDGDGLFTGIQSNSFILKRCKDPARKTHSLHGSFLRGPPAVDDAFR